MKRLDVEAGGSGWYVAETRRERVTLAGGEGERLTFYPERTRTVAGPFRTREGAAIVRDRMLLGPAMAGSAAVAALAGLLAGLALDGPARAAIRAELLDARRSVAIAYAGQARADRAIVAADLVLGQAVPLCGALADLQPARRAVRVRGQR